MTRASGPHIVMAPNLLIALTTRELRRVALEELEHRCGRKRRTEFAMQVGDRERMDAFWVIVGAIETDTIGCSTGLRHQVSIETQIARHADCRFHAHVCEESTVDVLSDHSSASTVPNAIRCVQARRAGSLATMQLLNAA